MGCWGTAGPTYQYNTSRLLTGSDVDGRGHKTGAWIVWRQNWCRKWNFDDDLLGWCTGGHSYFTLDEESLCKILKVCDNDCAGNLMLILGLEMESIVFTLSKHLVVIWKFLRYWNNIVIMVVKTKLVKITHFLIMKW